MSFGFGDSCDDDDDPYWGPRKMSFGTDAPSLTLEYSQAKAREKGWQSKTDALEEIARNAETLLAGGLPHFSRRDFAETVAHCARHALGQPVSFDSVQIRIKLRFNDGRVEYEELDGVKLDAEGRPPQYFMHRGTTKFEHGHNRRTIDGRFIYDEIA